MQSCLEIVVPVNSKGVYSYLPPENILCDSLIGKRVTVPFLSKKLTGIVIGITEIDNPSFKLKQIIDVIDKDITFDKNLINLIKWVSNYYYSDLGLCFKAALPIGSTPENKIFIKLLKEPNIFELDEISGRLIGLLKLNNNLLDIKSIEKKLKISEVLSKLKPLLDDNYLAVLDKKSNTVAYIERLFIHINKQKIKSINDINYQLKLTKVNSTGQIKLLNYLRNNFDKELEQSEVSKLLSIGSSVFKALESKGVIVRYKKNISRVYEINKNLYIKNELEIDLNEEQINVYNSILNSINSDSFFTHLLFGITGSGKSLVYFKLIKYILAKDKNVLLLLPEISLTSHFIARVELAFPNEVLIYHSQLSIGQRYENWEKIKNGDSKIIVGTRSAIFLPIRKLGLIIIDEEHETAYKQEDPNPRYHGRDTAIKRAKLENIPIILGSATPSFESYFNAKSGRYILNEIKERADGALLPEVTIVDSLMAKHQNQMNGSLTNLLLDAIENRLTKNEKIIIYQNRRGYSSFVECQECGDVPICQNCDIALTYHKSINKLSCHYCGYNRYVSVNCSECNSNSLEIIGTGTQRVEEEIEKYFNEKNIKVNIKRVDLDSTSKKGSFSNIIQEFNTGDVDILVGTQMIAKGLDLEKVTLVGVINADLQLYIPDFRSTERTFQLLTQVSGRAGRSNEYRGEVIVQSHHPENYTLLQSAKHNFPDFYKSEIIMREGANYPPFTRFIKVEFKSKNEDSILKYANNFYNLIEENKNYYLIYKPVIPVIFKLHKMFRVIMIIKSNKNTDANGKLVRRAIRNAKKEFEKYEGYSSVRINIDIDTYSSF